MTMPGFSPAIFTVSPVLPPRQIVSLHTIQGVQLYQFGIGSDMIEMTWSREKSTPSKCDLTVPSTLDYNRLPDIVPWLHWISVWDDSGQDLLWTGPIQSTAATRKAMTISARDMSALFTRTRCPMQKSWDVEWPVTIAAELIAELIKLHGLQMRAVQMPIHPLQYDMRYDFQANLDGTMFDAVMDNLVKLGLVWTVIAGVPVLGYQDRTPITALSQDHFVGDDLTVVRDGSQTYNDVLLRGADNIAQASVEMAGLHLQNTVSIDNMFGVSNTDRAVKQYVGYYGRMRDTISVANTAVLHPYAPVTLAQLIPTSRIVVDAYGLLVQMELTGIDVTYSSTNATVGLRLASVDDTLPELTIVKNRPTTSGKGSNASSTA